MLDMEAINNFSIDKSDWQKVKFGDVVFEPKESAKDPVAEGIEHVVGLEHIDSGDIHLRRSASIEESTTFTKKFSKGDVLFGRRRAYLKKAAIAEFEGICSGDITVMRARQELLSLGLLPFLVNNDKFFDFAIKHSAGGLSPRVKFKDLAMYEILVPPMNVQYKLLKLFESLNEVNETNKTQVTLLDTLFWSLLKSEFKNRELNTRIQDLTVDKYGIVDGPFGSNLKSIHYREFGIPVLQSGYVTKGEFSVTENIYVEESKYLEQIRSSAVSGDILMAKIGANYGECAIIPSGFDKTLIAGNAIRIRVNNEICNTKYLLFLLKFLKRVKVFEKHVTTTAQPALTISSLKNIKMHLPTKDEQNDFVEKCEKVLYAELKLSEACYTFKNLFTSISSKVL